jgi:hypothetical protein
MVCVVCRVVDACVWCLTSIHCFAVGQLNTYGFSKRADKHGHSVFKHALFKRDRPDLLPQIIKKDKSTAHSSG